MFAAGHTFFTAARLLIGSTKCTMLRATLFSHTFLMPYSSFGFVTPISTSKYLKMLYFERIMYRESFAARLYGRVDRIFLH